MILNDSVIRDLWYQALASEFGLRLILADPKDIRRIQNEFYRVRTELKDMRLRDLTINLPQGGTEVWLTQQGTDMTEGPIERRQL